MTSQAGQQVFTIYILPNISRSFGNQAIKFGQLIEYNVKNILLPNHVENKTGRLVSDHFLFLRKALYKIKASDQHLSFKIFW